MIVLSGGRLVLPDRVVEGGSLLIEGGHIAGVEPRPLDRVANATVRSMAGLTVVPGFIDVHVHGVDGIDLLDDDGAVARVAARLPRYGVTAFCPTSVACEAASLDAFLAAVGTAQAAAAPDSARVLRAHLESNFINPAWAGAQPPAHLRRPDGTGDVQADAFTAADIRRVLAARAAVIGIVTLAPELPGALDLVRELAARGHVVAMGHTGASYEEARAAIEAGVTHATHLFNRMTPLTHREPGVVGAVLESPTVVAELICDGQHVHPAAVALAARVKSVERAIAITDASACAGLPVGARARLGGQPIIATERGARLENGTLAGSVATMDAAFRMLVGEAGLPLVDAARMCATTPARQLGLGRRGRLAKGHAADLVVLDEHLRVVQVWIDGRVVAEPT